MSVLEYFNSRETADGLGAWVGRPRARKGRITAPKVVPPWLDRRVHRRPRPQACGGPHPCPCPDFCSRLLVSLSGPLRRGRPGGRVGDGARDATAHPRLEVVDLHRDEKLSRLVALQRVCGHRPPGQGRHPQHGGGGLGRLVVPEWTSGSRSVILMDWAGTLLVIGGLRGATRLFRERYHPMVTARSTERVLVVGAGEAGVELVNAIQRHPQLGMKVVGILDRYALGPGPGGGEGPRPAGGCASTCFGAWGQDRLDPDPRDPSAGGPRLDGRLLHRRTGKCRPSPVSGAARDREPDGPASRYRHQ